MSETFKPAPPSVATIITTLAFVAVFIYFATNVGLALTKSAYPPLFDAGGALILLGFIIYGWARSVKVYRVSPGELNIDRALIKGVHVPLELLKSVQVDADLGSFYNRSMLGSGGLFGWGGRARVRKYSDINAIDAYVYGSDPKHTVIFRLEGDQNIVVTPADPQGFVAAIRKANTRQDLITPKQQAAAESPKKRRRR